MHLNSFPCLSPLWKLKACVFLLRGCKKEVISLHIKLENKALNHMMLWCQQKEMNIKWEKRIALWLKTQYKSWGKNQQCTTEPPLVWGQALAKILKASSVQLRQCWATSKHILRCLSRAVLEQAEQRLLYCPFSWCPFCWAWVLLVLLGWEVLKASTSRKEREESWKLTHLLPVLLRQVNQPTYPSMFHALPWGGTGALRQQRDSESLPLQGRRISSW